jgi:hypothetical protein
MGLTTCCHSHRQMEGKSIGLGPLYLGQVGHICWMAKAKSSTGWGSLSYPTRTVPWLILIYQILRLLVQSLCFVMPFRILACSATALLGSEHVQALSFVGAWYQWDSVCFVMMDWYPFGSYLGGAICLFGSKPRFRPLLGDASA